jgi:hypothetical protein
MLPMMLSRNVGPTDASVMPPADMAVTATRYMSRALASLRRLSPSRMVRMRCGNLT